MYKSKIKNIAHTKWESTSLSSRAEAGQISVIKPSVVVPTTPIDLKGKFPRTLIFDKQTDAHKTIGEIVQTAQCGIYAETESDFASRKVARQGKSFPAPYLFEQVLTEYLEHRYDGSLMTPGTVQILAGKLRQMVFGDEEKYLSLYSDVDSVGRTAKATSKAGTTGKKNDPQNMADTLRDMNKPYSETAWSVMAQRYQRGKVDEFTNPIPRGVFNTNMVFVAQMGRYLYPLIDALQEVALSSDTLTPFSMYTGPYNTGRQAFNWVIAKNKNTNRPSEAFKSYNFDQKAFDQHFGRRAMKLFVDLTKGLFKAEVRKDYEEVMMAVFDMHIICDSGVEIVVAHLDAMLSGLLCTSIAETVVGWAVAEAIAMRCSIFVPCGDGTDYREYHINHFGGYKIVSNGDDLSMLVKMPPNSKVGTISGKNITGIEALVTSYFNTHGFETRLDKCSVLTNCWYYGMKMYSMSAVSKDADGRPAAFLPVYTMAAALNACINPETPTVGSDVEEFKRIAMIMDQTVGHPMFDSAVTNMVAKFKMRKGEQAGQIFAELLSQVDLVDLDPKHRAYSFKDELWTSETSVFLRLFAVKLGLTEAQTAAATNLTRALAGLRAACWMLRIGSADAQGNLVLKQTDLSILHRALTCEFGVADSDEMMEIFTGLDGRIRESNEYIHQRPYAENLASDTPLTDYRKMHAKSSVTEEVVHSATFDTSADL